MKSESSRIAVAAAFVALAGGSGALRANSECNAYSMGVAVGLCDGFNENIYSPGTQGCWVTYNTGAQRHIVHARCCNSGGVCGTTWY